MSDGLTIQRQVHFGKATKGRRVLESGAAPEKPPVMPEGNVPRISRLMAMAIRYQEMIESGELADRADLARLGRVTRARATQVMNLLQLAPDIQEEILHLPRTERGRDPIRERHVRRIAAVLCWGQQRRMWRGLGQGGSQP